MDVKSEPLYWIADDFPLTRPKIRSVLKTEYNRVVGAKLLNVVNSMVRTVARTLIGGGVYIHIFGFCPTEINFILKETSRAEPEYMNIHPPN